MKDDEKGDEQQEPKSYLADDQFEEPRQKKAWNDPE